MKKSRSYCPLLLAIFAVFFFQKPLLAQIDMRSEDFSVGFKAPSNFQVTEDDVEKFSASNEHLTLTISSVPEGDISTETLAEAVLTLATELHYSVRDKTVEINFEDFWGHYTKGRNSDGNALVMAILEKESQVDVWLVVIAYTDDQFEDALAIAKSFYR